MLIYGIINITKILEVFMFKNRLVLFVIKDIFKSIMTAAIFTFSCSGFLTLANLNCSTHFISSRLGVITTLIAAIIHYMHSFQTGNSLAVQMLTDISNYIAIERTSENV